MVNRVLHDYVRQLRHRMLHIPLRAQRRITNEVVAHVEHEARALRVEHREWTTEQATQQAIEKFCPVDEAIAVFGPEEGIIRRSSAEWVVRGSAPRPGRGVSEGRRWGAAAAAILVIGATIGVLAWIAESPAPAGFLEPEELTQHQYVFNAVTGENVFTVEMAADGTMAVEAAGFGGCVHVVLLSPLAVVHESDPCLHGTMTASPAPAGTWRVELDLDDFTGVVTIRMS